MALLLRQVCAAALWRLAPRQAHGERRTLARLACDGHVAAHHARELQRARPVHVTNWGGGTSRVRAFHNNAKIDNKRLFEQHVCQVHVSLAAFNRHLQLSNWGALSAVRAQSSEPRLLTG